MISFTIPGKPQAKQRARFNRRSGSAYTPRETFAFEDTVRVIASQHFPQPMDGAVKLTVLATFEIPKSWSKKKAADHLWRHHTQKPDLDNVLKAIKDGLNRIAYHDDGQVAEVIGRKVWGSPARTVVVVLSAK